MGNVNRINDFQGFLEKNKATFGKHTSQRIFILGTGPSVNQVDISLLKGETVVATNVFTEHPQFTEIAPQYYVTADPRFYQADADGGVLSTFLKIIGKIQKASDRTKLFLPLNYAYHLRNLTELQKLDINWFLYGQNIDPLAKIDFSQAIPPLGQNILNIALMLAFHLDASEIYLTGFDHGGVVKTFDKIKHHFYKKLATDDSSKQIYSSADLERCMFTHLNQLQILKRYLEKYHISLFTTSKDGGFKMFPYVRYSSLFRERLTSITKLSESCRVEDKVNQANPALTQLEKVGEYPKNYFQKLGEYYEALGDKQRAEKAYSEEGLLYGNPETSLDRSTRQTIVDVIKDFVIADGDAECCQVYSKGTWQSYSRSGFWQKVEQYSGLFSSYCQPGSLILFIKQTDINLLAAFIGAIHAGMRPALLSPKTRKIAETEYHRKVDHILEQTEAKYIFSDTLSSDHSFEGVKLLTPDMSHVKIKPASNDSEIALAQFSSGSTGLQKAVFISHGALIKHMKNYGDAIALTEQDRIVSWLPLYHDMGLIACFLMPLMRGVPFMIMDPFDWLTRPQLLFDAIATYRCSLCYLPNFAFHVLANKCQSVDFSSMRMFVNCSEPARDSSQQLFLQKFPGLKKENIAVCYALAENTFAVSQTPVAQAPVSKTLNGKKILSCGQIIPDTKVKIINANNDGIGEVAICGDSLFSYFLGGTVEKTEGYYPTGDLGFIDNDELFITGRIKDLIIINGKNFYPQDIEHCVSEVEGVYPGRVVCFGVENYVTGTEQLVILLETNANADSNKVLRNIHQNTLSEFEVIPITEILPYMTLVKTSSGKVSRTRNRELYLARNK